MSEQKKDYTIIRTMYINGEKSEAEKHYHCTEGEIKEILEDAQEDARFDTATSNGHLQVSVRLVEPERAPYKPNEVTISDILNDFEYKAEIEDGKYVLTDLQGAGDLEDERFDSIEEMLDRLSANIQDTYMVSEILISEPGIDIPDLETAYRLAIEYGYTESADKINGILHPETIIDDIQEEDYGRQYVVLDEHGEMTLTADIKRINPAVVELFHPDTNELMLHTEFDRAYGEHQAIRLAVDRYNDLGYEAPIECERVVEMDEYMDRAKDPSDRIHRGVLRSSPDGLIPSEQEIDKAHGIAELIKNYNSLKTEDNEMRISADGAALLVKEGQLATAVERSKDGNEIAMPTGTSMFGASYSVKVNMDTINSITDTTNGRVLYDNGQEKDTFISSSLGDDGLRGGR